MNSSVAPTEIAKIAPSTVADRGLFSFVWLRWKALTPAERVTCGAIVLIPLWWLWGWKHLLILLAMTLVGLDLKRNGKLRWRRPSTIVLSALVFGCYVLVNRFFYNQLTGSSFSPNSVLTVLNSWFGFAILFWYIQSKHIRVRWQVVAWACSVVAIAMLAFWAVIYFGLHQGGYAPPRSLYGFLTGKSLRYVPGAGNSNYLLSYFPYDESLIPGMVRYIFFLPGPEALALVAGFFSCLALDLKPRLWSISLFGTAIFILLLSGTRSVLVALPIALAIRYLFVTKRVLGPGVFCAIAAALSLGLLAFPDVTGQVMEALSGTATATADFRGDSTEVRLEIYRQTWNAIANAPDLTLLFGHTVSGETVLRGYDPARVGSHSFLLGTLLYRAGLFGATIFATFWISLLAWLYRTRASRPICVLPTLVLLSLTFVVMELEMPVMPIVLLCVLMLQPATVSGLRSRSREPSWDSLGCLRSANPVPLNSERLVSREGGRSRNRW
ncbi:O-antigen ligase family protein [Synechococcus sp. PCC 7336]|uniref:O-antigen ligase family protein n=1 Tax=Synechococcus sp. PCC 7336 TaxID=195250 RepID=UPI0003465EE9|nr:O-antigen ligase family protein [Synechococcus sp. PCC 7336]